MAVCHWLERLFSCVGLPLFLCGWLLHTVDSYPLWLRWTYEPVMVILLLPLVVLCLVYVSAVLSHLYRLRAYLLGTLIEGFSDPRHAGMRLIALIWDIQGRIFHGYEISGLEKLPVEGPVFVVYYHGTLPIDVYYFMARIILLRNRAPCPVIDRFVFRIPGLSTLLENLQALSGSVESCARVLAPGGRMLLLSPGGVREALFADEFYSVLWGRRIGFAKVAIKAGVPIYPMFTENVRDVVRVVQYGKSWFRRLYEKTRLPLAILYGYFPVKLRTYIGDPIYPASHDPQQLADLTRESIEALISEHQLVPGNLLRGILQRFPPLERWLKSKPLLPSQLPNPLSFNRSPPLHLPISYDVISENSIHLHSCHVSEGDQ